MTAREANLRVMATLAPTVPRSELDGLQELTRLATDVINEARTAGDLEGGLAEALVGLTMKAWSAGRAYGKEQR